MEYITDCHWCNSVDFLFSFFWKKKCVCVCVYTPTLNAQGYHLVLALLDRVWINYLCNSLDQVQKY